MCTVRALLPSCSAPCEYHSTAGGSARRIVFPGHAIAPRKRAREGRPGRRPSLVRVLSPRASSSDATRSLHETSRDGNGILSQVSLCHSITTSNRRGGRRGPNDILRDFPRARRGPSGRHECARRTGINACTRSVGTPCIYLL